MARPRLQRARLGPDSIISYSLSSYLSERPTLRFPLSEVEGSITPGRYATVSDKPSFFAELKRRNVYKVAVAYAVAAWLVVQAASLLLATFEAPSWAMKIFV